MNPFIPLKNSLLKAKFQIIFGILLISLSTFSMAIENESALIEYFMKDISELLVDLNQYSVKQIQDPRLLIERQKIAMHTNYLRILALIDELPNTSIKSKAVEQFLNRYRNNGEINPKEPKYFSNDYRQMLTAQHSMLQQMAKKNENVRFLTKVPSDLFNGTSRQDRSHQKEVKGFLNINFIPSNLSMGKEGFDVEIRKVLAASENKLQLSTLGQESLSQAAQAILEISQRHMQLTIYQQLGFAKTPGLTSVQVRIAQSVIRAMVEDKLKHPEANMGRAKSIFTDFDIFVIVAKMFSNIPANTPIEDYDSLAKDLVHLSLVNRSFASAMAEESNYQSLESKFASLSGENIKSENIRTTLNRVLTSMESYRHSKLRDVSQDTVEKNSLHLAELTQDPHFSDPYIHFTQYLSSEYEKFENNQTTELEFMNPEELLREHQDLSKGFNKIRNLFSKVMNEAKTPSQGAILNTLMLVAAVQYRVVTQFDVQVLITDLYLNGAPTHQLISTLSSLVEDQILEPSALKGLELMSGIYLSVIDKGIGQWVQLELAKLGVSMAFSSDTQKFKFLSPSKEKLNLSSILKLNQNANLENNQTSVEDSQRSGKNQRTRSPRVKTSQIQCSKLF